MSRKVLKNILIDQKEGTLIKTIIVSENYSKITDVDKNQYPLLHVMITGGKAYRSTNEAFFNKWNVTANLYMLPPVGGSKGDLPISEEEDLSDDMEAVIAHYQNNLFNVEEFNTIDTMEMTTSIPTKINGAMIWQTTMIIDMLNQNKLCIDC